MHNIHIINVGIIDVNLAWITIAENYIKAKVYHLIKIAIICVQI